MQERKFGYARVSMDRQDLALQFDALIAAGVNHSDIFVEKRSGSLGKSDRPQLKKCLKILKQGDTLVVWKLDRLGRSLKDLINFVQTLEERSIHFKSLTETIDTSSPTGRLIFHVIGAFGEFERNLIKERSLAGLAAARKRGVVGGRRYKLTIDQQQTLVGLYLNNTPIATIRDQFAISKTCLYDYLKMHNCQLRKQYTA